MQLGLMLPQQTSLLLKGKQKPPLALTVLDDFLCNAAGFALPHQAI